MKAHEPLSEQAISNLDSPVIDVDATTGEVLRTTGFMRNLRIISTQTETTVSGSLTKAVLGHNFGSTTPEQMADLLAYLAVSLDIDVLNASVYRLDVGLCLTTPFPLSRVVPTFGPLKRYEQDVYRNGRTGLAYVRGKQRALLVYDKEAEMKAKNQKAQAPEEYRGKHVTRIELQLKRKLKDAAQLGREVSGALLTETTFHLFLLQRLQEEFNEIMWLPKPAEGVGKNWSQHRDLLIRKGIEARGGVNAEINRVRNARKEGDLFDSPNASYRMEEGIRKVMESNAENRSSIAWDFGTAVNERFLAHQDLLRAN